MAKAKKKVTKRNTKKAVRKVTKRAKKVVRKTATKKAARKVAKRAKKAVRKIAKKAGKTMRKVAKKTGRKLAKAAAALRGTYPRCGATNPAGGPPCRRKKEHEGDHKNLGGSEWQ